MFYSLNLHGFDMLDQVHGGLVVQDLSATDQRKVLQLAIDIPGEGIDDPAEWARDLLVAVLEQL